MTLPPRYRDVMRSPRLLNAVAFAVFSTLLARASVGAPTGLIAEGADMRVDLVWNSISDSQTELFNVYRAPEREGPWTKINSKPHTFNVYSDFLHENGNHSYYRVTQVLDPDGKESAASEIVDAKTAAMNDDKLLDSVQKAFFRYFWDFGHPVSGLAREGFGHPRSVVTTGGTGFGMITIMVGAERGFVTRAAAAERLLKMVRFLEDKAHRYHGIWSHHLRGDTGETLAFAGSKDNGGDLVESAFLLEGMLTVAEYFDADNPVERELRERVDRLWKEAEWDWYLQKPDSKVLYWHWSPDNEWVMNHPVDGWNECIVVYLLALASPTHAIAPDCYYLGWARNVDRYVNGKEYYGIKQPVGKPLGGPLFFTHYSFLGVDPRRLTDAYTNYYDNNRAISQIQQAYAIENPNGHRDYGKLEWGLTACQNPRGYKAHEPAPGADRDDGTIAPTAAVSAFPYTPDESLATLKHFYYDLGPSLWGSFGFYDAFNKDANWTSPSFLAIDQGTMTPMIENHRTGLPWKMFMKSAAASTMLEKLEEAKPAAKQPGQGR
jgi:hypothetical protein